MQQCKDGIQQIDEDLLIPDKTKSLNEGVIKTLTDDPEAIEFMELECLCKHYKIDMNKPWSKLSKKEQKVVQVEQNEPKELKVALVEPQEEPQEEFDFLIHETNNNTAVASAMKYAVIDHASKEDEGLKFYRNPEFKDSVEWFYNQITGNEFITDAILQYADKNEIPLSLAFSLAYSESSYNPRAINKNTNASIDRGLFQLNNNSFPDLIEEEYFDPYISAKYGLSHLRFCLDTAGNEVAALAMYNAGTRRVKNGETPQVTLNYVSKIMDYKEGLDDLFEFQSENWLDSKLFESIALLR